MQEADAEWLCAELHGLIELGPGRNPTALGRAHMIIDALGSAMVPADVEQKIDDLAYWLEQWFSADSWNRQNDHGQLVLQFILGDIQAIELAIGVGLARYAPRGS